MSKVKGIGGIFFKSDNPEKLNAWYKENLGLYTTGFGAKFDWSSAGKGDFYTLWSPFSANTNYFEPSQKQFMINFIVKDLGGLVLDLKNKGVNLIGEISEYEYGKFAHIVDPEGNKIELWEPAAENPES